MENGNISPPPHRVIDIQHATDDTTRSMPLNLGQRDKQPMGPSGRRINRQVSLETGSSRKERKALPRSGKSVGVGMLRVGAGGGRDQEVQGERKGDFSMFRTKSTLVKQMSMMPVRKDNNGSNYDEEEERRKNSENNGNGESGGHNQGGGGGGGGGVGDKNVPAAGRYFAALRGPELDQVRVNYMSH